MPAPQEEVLRIAATIKVSEQELSKATDFWRAAQNRFMRIVETEAPDEAIEYARMEATCSYEKICDILKVKGDQYLLLKQAKARLEARRRNENKKPPREYQ